MTQPIDFVITWVDNNDPSWRADYLKFSGRTDDDSIRYRDWDSLRFWFRGVEKFAPWVNKIFFITCGHVPEWLNVDAPKLRVISHSDYMDGQYLPTFSSHPIEFCLHRIEGLSDRFVYFNDDTFLINDVKPTRFFVDGLPCDMAILSPMFIGGMHGHTVYNALDIINTFFKKRTVIKENPLKWFHPQYGTYLIRNLFDVGYSYFTGFYDHHLPQGYLKETFEDAWKHNRKSFEDTCSHKFRCQDDVCIWVMRYWQLATGRFHPLNLTSDSKYFLTNDVNVDEVSHVISSQRKNVIVINDSLELNDFEKAKKVINQAFMKILPDKSCYEL
ncbi:MAG: Stealth CR1 domain-containing protein [Prevotella sp.]|nr:Stealth CR1 domain-containing protein [Prevotella sp.]